MKNVSVLQHYVIVATIALSSALLYSCAAQSLEPKEICLTDASANIIKVNTLISDSIWIQLENTPEAMIGEAKKIIDHNDIFYILNAAPNREIIAFDRNGKYLNAIGRQGHGEGEYSDIIDFTVNTTTGEIAILAPNSDVYIYNSDGTFVTKHRPTESLLWHITCDGEHYICSTDQCTYTEGDNAFLLYVFTQDFSLVEKYIPVLSQQMPSTSMFEGMLSTIGMETYYMDMFTNTLYRIHEGEPPMPIFSFIMPDPMPIDAFAGGMTFYQQQTTHDWIKTFLPLDNSFLLTYAIRGNLCITEISKDGKPKFEGLVGGIFPKMFPGTEGTILSPVTREEYFEEWMNVPVNDIEEKEAESNIMLLRWRLASQSFSNRKS